MMDDLAEEYDYMDHFPQDDFDDEADYGCDEDNYWFGRE